jgi:aminopeptidase N
VLGLLGRCGDPVVLAEARKRFAAWQRKPSSLSADLRRIVLDLVGRTGGAQAFDVLLAKARAAEDVKEQRDLYFALAGTLDPKLAARALAETLRPGLDTSFQVRLMRQVGYAHPALTRAFMQREAGKLLANRPPQERAEAVTAAYRGFFDEAAAAELTAYGERTLPAAAQQEVRKEATRIRGDAAERARLVPAFDAWARPEAKK